MEYTHGGKRKRKKKKRRNAVEQQQQNNIAVHGAANLKDLSPGILSRFFDDDRSKLSSCNAVEDHLDTIEIFLSDFANAPDKRDALKKMSKKMTSTPGSFPPNCLPKVLDDVGKSLDRIPLSDDDTPWYDREDIEDIDEASNMGERSDTESGAQVPVHVDLLPRRRYAGVPAHEVCGRDLLGRLGNRYPFDIWCLLANYIKPEQIQTFACLCRGANEAVNSVCFWIRLYQNFVADIVTLPDRLKPDWIESRAGLKMRVVRALFIGYGNLKNFLLRQTLEGARNTRTLSKLVGLRCCRTWYKASSTGKPNCSYTFYFKFKCELQEMVPMSALDEESNYLTWNCERTFIVLQLTVSNFVCLESVCGETLTDISMNLSRNMRYHCVKMMFHSYRNDGKYRKNDGTMTVLDPVCELRLLRWWNPSYPHWDE